jgi:hypothetical protein
MTAAMAQMEACDEVPLLPPPLWGRVAVGGGEVMALQCPTRRPLPPALPQPNLAIARVRPLNKATEIGNSRFQLGVGRRAPPRIAYVDPTLPLQGKVKEIASPR